MQIPELRHLQDILTSFLGRPKNDVTDTGQLQFNCPRCIDEKGAKEIGKYNLEVNIFKGIFKCWSCCTVDDDMRGTVRKLVLKYGGREAWKDYEDTLNEIRANKLYNLPDFKALFDSIDEFYLRLPVTYKRVNLKTCRRQVREYLEKRHITQDIIDRFKIGYTNWEEPKPIDRNRIIIPSYGVDDSLNYWVGRDFTGNDKRQKYKNCEGVKKTDIIFQESLIRWDADIVLVEGALDCIYGNNTIALLGKTLDKDYYLYQKLFERANANIIICLDGDTQINETKRIYKILDRRRLKGHIRYINMSESGYKDFGEAYEAKGRAGIIELLQHQKTFSEIELVI
jgi:DNA primase